MEERYGIILIDGNEVVMRIYETSEKEWRLLYYCNKAVYIQKQASVNSLPFTEAIAELLSSQPAQHIATWRTYSRCLSKQIIVDLNTATGLKIEMLDKSREQELLCKGMFTELW